MNFIYQNGLIKKSNNTVSKIMNRYIVTIIPFLLLTVIYNIYTYHNYNILLNILLTNIVCLFSQYAINLIKKDSKIKNIFIKDNILILSLMLSIFTINLDYSIIFIISLIVTIFKNIFNLNNKALLIGIILINIYKIYYLKLDMPLESIKNIKDINNLLNYSSIKNYLLGFNQYYLSSILALIMYIYLFHKKSIKFIIPVSILITYMLIITIISIKNGLYLWYPLFSIITGNIVFLSIFIATDYINTPYTFEGQIIYGIIIGIILCILQYIVPELAISISILIVTLFTNYIDKLSFKLKYNQKFYTFILIFLILFVITEAITLSIIL